MQARLWGGGRRRSRHDSKGRDIRLTFSATPLSVRRALETVTAALDGLDVGEEEAGIAEIVLAEVLNNVVEHAYRGAGAGWVQLRCRHATDGLQVTIRDRGRPMPEGTLDHRNALTMPDPADPPEGGFGWVIVGKLAENVVYRRVGDINELEFLLPVCAPLH